MLHLHGALFFAWTLLLVFQARLVAHGRVDLHRTLGLAGISLATGMVFTAVALVVRAMSSAAASANASFVGAVAIGPISQITLFAAFFAVGIANRRRPATHKRCMLIATANLLGAPIARMLGTLVAPENGGVASIASVTEGDPRLLVAAIGGALAIDLLVVAAMLHDRRTLGRVHRIYVIGIASMVLVQLLRLPFAQTSIWRSISEALASLGA